eukprot:1456882-Lingulodinium_polyedra.AAC.1
MPEKRPPPFTLPFRIASEFGIIEQNAIFMGFQELVDAEQIVPVLRLDLKEATEEDVESAMAGGPV